jgi:hypothetical protein
MTSAEEAYAVRSRIVIGLTKEGQRTYSISIVVGDSREEIDQAVDEAARVEQRLAERP